MPPGLALAAQPFVDDNVVNVSDEAEAGRGHEGQRRGRDKEVVLLSDYEDESFVAKPLRQHLVWQRVDENWPSNLRIGANDATRSSGDRTAVVVFTGGE